MCLKFNKWYYIRTGTDISVKPSAEQARQKAIYDALTDENEDTGFPAWFQAYCGKDFLELKSYAYRLNSSNKDVQAFTQMKEICMRKYREEKELMILFLEAPFEKPEFNRWLKLRTGKTCGQLYALARATGNYKSYEKMIDWYSNRYQLEQNNPFLEAAETVGTGE